MEKKENELFQALAQIIEQGKKEAVYQVNSALTIVYWQIGHKINTHILEDKRAEYGKAVVKNMATLLEGKYGRQFNVKNLRRMLQFANVFEDFQIVAPLARQLSWSHFSILIPLKSEAARNFYAELSANEMWSKRELRRQIDRKAFERNEIAQIQMKESEESVQNSFKDPYFFDFLGIKQGYLETDLEGAILRELEGFVLELGRGFAFVERQKRMTIDGEDFYLDLLFFHRKLKRLVAIELKLGKFRAGHKGQMELYLKWLNKNERQAGEKMPVGLILCAEKSTEQIELLEMGKEGIMVAEYWTELPPKSVLEEKLHHALIAAKNKLELKNWH